MSKAPYKLTFNSKLEDADGVSMAKNEMVYENLEMENVVEIESAILEGSRALAQKAAERKKGKR